MARFHSPFLERNPVFRQFLSASAISLLGSSIFDIAMPLYVWERTHSAIALSMVNVGLLLPYFVMAPLTGYSVDQFDKRRVMLLSDLGQVCAMLFLLLYDLSGSAAIWPIVCVVFVAKTMMITFETVTTFQLVPALVPPGDLSQANTWFLSSLRGIQIVGPLTAGVLMTVLGVRACVALNILSFGATLYFVYSMKNLTAMIEGPEPQPKPPVRLQSMIDNFTQSASYVWKSELFRPFIFLMFFWNLSSLIPNTPSIIYYFTADHHFTPAEYGLVVSLIGIFGIAGYLLSGPLYERVSFNKAFVGSCLWQATLGTVSLAFLPTPLAMSIVFAVSRMGSSVLNMGTFLIRQTRVPKARMGGVNSCLRMFFMSAAPVSAFCQGIILHKFGVALSFALGAACLWGTVWYAREVGAKFQPMESKRERDDQAA